MPYIARTNGGQTVMEIRQGVLADIPEADRGNWRNAVEVRPTIDGIKQTHTGPTLTVNGDGSQVNIVWGVATADPAWVRMRLRDYAAQVRFQKEVGGLVLPNGVKVDTDRDSQAKVQQAHSLLEKGWVASIDWKADSGWVTLDLAVMTGIAQAVAAHVQGCFSAEKAVIEAIEAGAVTTSAEVAAWPWP